jgi:hypothetical protein
LHQITDSHLLAGAAFTVRRELIHGIAALDRAPRPGDLVCGKVMRLGEYEILEDREGRAQPICEGSRVIVVLGNRYAPDVFEGGVPDHLPDEIDLLSRSGVSGVMRVKHAGVKDPTRIRVEGCACDAEGRILNTRDLCPPDPGPEADGIPRAKMILSIGTSMSSGKTTAAAACCEAIRAQGHTVSAAKVTGTASRRDVFLIRDSGADPVAEFCDLGYPSTHGLPEEELIELFCRLDRMMAGPERDFWVVEISDGILQRETAMLLRSEAVRSRLHRLIFSAIDACGAIGGIHILREDFGLVPDAISGICSSSPLGIREIQSLCDTPVINSPQRDLSQIADLLI